MRGGRHHSYAADAEDANNAAYVPSEEEQEDEDEDEEEDVSPKKRCCWRTAWPTAHGIACAAFC